MSLALDTRSSAAETATAGRIGPNAVTRIADALSAADRPRVFARAGLAYYLDAPPTAPVDEREVARLHAALSACLGPILANQVAAIAGRATADYLLTHRVPRSARFALALMPRALAAPLLMRAVGRHAWTFAGSGRLSYRCAGDVALVISGGPLANPAARPTLAAYYAACFEALFEGIFRRPVSARAIHCDVPAACCGVSLDWG